MGNTPPQSNNSIRDFYSTMYAAFGPSPQGLGWGSKNLQALRFEALSRFWEFHERVVLDVGCGICDLYEYLRPRAINRYIGIDFVDAYCEFARGRFSDSKFEVLNRDLFSSQTLPSCDIALASGTFNVMDFVSEDESYNAIEKVMNQLRSVCRMGFSMNFLSDATTFRDENLFYANSERILSIARGISRRLILSHFEFPFEFVLHVWSDEKYDASKSLYQNLWPPK